MYLLAMVTAPAAVENLCYEVDNMANSTDAKIIHDAVILIPHRITSLRHACFSNKNITFVEKLITLPPPL